MYSTARALVSSLFFLIVLFACFGLYADTDLEVTYIERTPKYTSYQGYHGSSVRYSGKWFTDDWITYYATYATGLYNQPPGTKRWPDPGETVTWTAHVYNRGTTTISSFDYVWTIDDLTVDSGTFNIELAPGDFETLSIDWTWEFVEHDIKFSTTVAGDSHTSNNELMVYSNSLGLFTFIDFGYADDFRDYTPEIPNPSTDSITEWLQLHCARMNDMFIEAGCDLRWRYDRLDFVEDGQPLPSYEATNYDGAFPERYSAGQGDVRGGYYDEGEDISYALLHELAHQLGIVDIYQMDVPGSANEVNGEGYFAQPGLMHGASHFISPHTAGAMNAWHGKRRGFFGQYLYDIPTNNKLKVLSVEGLPVPDLNVTFYEYVETSGGKKIPNIPKFIGVTDENGIYNIPNVELMDKGLFWSDTGNVLNDNPFGYVWCIGINCVFFIQLEKEGKVDYVWLDITRFNEAYWAGETDLATYEVESTFRVAPALVGGLELAVLDRPYNGQLEVSKGIPPYTFSLLRGTMPTGLTLNSDGSITGTPTERGDSPVVIELTDSSAEPFVSEWDVTVQVIDPGFWQMFQNTKRRIGTSVVAGPTQFSTLWCVTNSSVGVMAPALTRWAAFYGASWPSNTVWKIKRDGTKLWQGDGNIGGHLNGTPAIGLEGESSSSVYIGGGYILDISKNNGQTNWNTSPTGYSDYIALGNNSTVYAHQWNNTMFGLRDDGSSYSVVFTGVTNQDCRSPAALYDLHDEGEIMTWGGRSGWIYAVKTDDWSYLWSLQMPGTKIDMAPCVDSLNTLYYATMRDNKEFFFAVDGRTGKPVWEIYTGRDQIWASGCGALSMDQDTYYIQTQGNSVYWTETTDALGWLYAIDTAEGVVKWSLDTKHYGWDMTGYSCIVDRAGKVYVTANKTIYCVQDNGAYPSVVWSAQADPAPQSFSMDDRGVLYLGGRVDGYSGLHAIYSEPAAVKPVILDVARNGSGNIEITWESQQGMTYRVEASTDQYDYSGGGMTWATAGDDIPTGGAATTWEDTSTPVSGWKFYRVYTKDAGGDLVADDTVGAFVMGIVVGRNLVSCPFEPYPEGGGIPGSSSLDKIIGDQLTGSAFSQFFSDTVEVWDKSSANYKRAWNDTAKWVDWDTASDSPQFGWDADVGYWITILSFNPAADLTQFGRVSMTDRVMGIARGRNLVGSCFPVDVALADSGLIESGFTGSTISFFSDTIEFWNQGTNNYDRCWYDTGAGSWKEWNNGVLCDIQPGDGLWITVLSFNSAFTWTYPTP